MPDPKGQSKALAFGRVPYEPIDAGIVVQMSNCQAKVYLVIAAHVNGETYSARPSLATIARQTGTCERTVRRAIRCLVDKGIIAVEGCGGRRKSNVYTLATNPDTLGVHVSKDQCGENPDTLGVHVSGDQPSGNPDKTSAKPGHPERKPGQNEGKTRTPCMSNEQRNRRTEEQNVSAPPTDETNQTENPPSNRPTRGQFFITEGQQTAPSIFGEPGAKPDGRILGIARLVDQRRVDPDWALATAKRMHEGWASKDGKAANGISAVVIYAKTIHAHTSDEPLPQNVGELAKKVLEDATR